MRRRTVVVVLMCSLLSAVLFGVFSAVRCSAQDLPAEQSDVDRLQGDNEIEGFYQIVEHYPDLDSLKREHAKLSHYLGNPDLEKGVVLNTLEMERERKGKDTLYIDGMKKIEEGYRVKAYDVGGDCQIVETRGDITFTHETISRVLYCEEEMALLAGFGGRQDRLIVITRKMRRIGLDVITNAVANFGPFDAATVKCESSGDDAVTCNISDQPCSSVTRPYGSRWIMEFKCAFRH